MPRPARERTAVASGAQNNGKDASDDRDIREIEHGPESEVHKVNDAVAPETVKQVAGGSTKCRTQRNKSQEPLKEWPKMNQRNEDPGLDKPKSQHHPSATHGPSVHSLVQDRADSDGSEGRGAPMR